MGWNGEEQRSPTSSQQERATTSSFQPSQGSLVVDKIPLLVQHQKGTEVLGMIIVTEEPRIFD